MFIKKLDIFGSKLQLTSGLKEEQKKTIVGAILTVIVFSLSFGYLGYLIWKYSTNQFLPKVISSDSSPPEGQDIDFDDDQFMFTMLIQNKPMRQFEAEQGKQYFQIKIQYIEAVENTNIPKMTTIQTQECSNSQYQYYDCLKFDSVPNKIFFHKSITTGKFLASNFVIKYLRCYDQANCATSSAIDDILQHPANHLAFYTRIEQYDPKALSFKQIYITQIYQLSYSLMVFSSVNIFKETSIISQGFIFQKDTSYDKVKAVKRVDSFFTIQDSIASTSSNNKQYLTIASIVLVLDQTLTTTHYEFPAFTEILAQFSGVFSSLLAIGIIGNIISKNKINNDVQDLILQNYLQSYSVSNSDIRKKDNKNQNKILPLHDQKDKISAEFLIQHKNEFATQKQLLQQFGSQLSNDEKIKFDKAIEDLTVKTFDAYNFFKELITLKKAIKLIFEPEQYAALRFCGQNLNSILNQSSEGNQESNFILEDIEQIQLNKDSNTDSEKLTKIDEEIDKVKPNTNKNSIFNIISNNKTKSPIIEFAQQNQNSPLFNSQTASENKLIKRLDNSYNYANNHLDKMETIQENSQIEKKLLNQFLKKFESINPDQISTLDKRIYSCLMKNK